MNILMLTEYFHPFAHGGTEWSVYYLAQALGKKGVSVTVLTPHYGSFYNEIWKGIRIKRFPFYIHTKKAKNISPFWHNNIFIWFVNSIVIFLYIVRYKIDIIHVQSKSYIVPSIFAKFFLRKPVVVTVRDYFPLCPYGLCITEKNNFKRCSVGFFYRYELRDYFQGYVQKLSPTFFLFQLFASVNARTTSYVMRFFLHFADHIVCISKKQQLIYRRNGFINAKVVYNMMEFNGIAKNKLEKSILFIGRITPGKGADLFVEASNSLLENKRITKAYVVGDGFLKSKLEKTNKSITFLSQLSYEKVLERIKRATLVVVPSVWEEPFGRVALEATSFGVPVIVSDRGGLPEILGNLNIGIVTRPDVKSLKKALVKGISENEKMRNAISKNYRSLENKFSKTPVTQYLKLYENFL